MIILKTKNNTWLLLMMNSKQKIINHRFTTFLLCCKSKLNLHITQLIAEKIYYIDFRVPISSNYRYKLSTYYFDKAEKIAGNCFITITHNTPTKLKQFIYKKYQPMIEDYVTSSDLGHYNAHLELYKIYKKGLYGAKKDGKLANKYCQRACQ